MLQTKKCKLCRREGKKLFLKGEKCNSPKCPFLRRPYAPGKSSKNNFQKMSDYGTQLRAKQSAKRTYKITEKVLRKYYDLATKSKTSTGEKILQLLETRIDNVVYRSGMASSRSQARQLVGHGHIKINDKKVDISSYQVKPKDIIRVSDKKKNLIANIKPTQETPLWLKVSKDRTKSEILSIPTKENIESNIDVQLIVEFYSR